MNLDKNIEQHYRKSELPFLQQASDWIDQARSENRPTLTSFLNSRQIYLLKSLVNRYPDYQVSTFGGYSKAEMSRAIIYPDYFEPNQSDYELGLLNIEYAENYSTIHHNQVLGTLMGSGIERNVFGDILTDGENWQLICSKHILQFLTQEIDHVGRTNVKLSEAPLTDIIEHKDDWEKIFVTLPSFRLDVVISISFKISRSEAKALIENGKVKLNWFEFKQANHDVQVHDMISVRGYGRLKVNESNGLSKKGKLKAEFGIIRNK